MLCQQLTSLRYVVRIGHTEESWEKSAYYNWAKGPWKGPEGLFFAHRDLVSVVRCSILLFIVDVVVISIVCSSVSASPVTSFAATCFDFPSFFTTLNVQTMCCSHAWVYLTKGCYIWCLNCPSADMHVSETILILPCACQWFQNRTTTKKAMFCQAQKRVLRSSAFIDTLLSSAAKLPRLNSTSTSEQNTVEDRLIVKIS